MRQVQVRAGPRIRHTSLADLPTLNRKIARRWFFQITADLCVQTI